MKQRRYDIDWLRVLAMFMVFLFHCARFFGGGNWHLQNDQGSFAALLFIGLLDLWIMPLFFLLSGVGTWYALKSRSNGQYIGERARRLLVPLYTVGLFLLVPPQAYFEAVTHQGWSKTLWASIPFYLRSLPGEMVPDYFGNPSFLVPYTFTGHLWFLQYLFIISLLTLPLLRYLKTEAGGQLIDRFATWSERRGGALLPIIPLALMLIVSRGWFQTERSWADFFVYTLFFLIGYILPADGRFTESIKRAGWLALGLGLAGFAGEGFFIEGLGYGYPGRETFSLAYVAFQVVMSVARWGWVVFILSLGAKYLNANNRTLAYASEAVLPFYLLHQTVILCVGWFVIPWEVSIAVKYLVIAATSFTLIIATYELLIRRFNLTRFLFGMRPLKREPQAAAPQPDGVGATAR
jgi:glucan biosynthesis protein C